MLQRLGSRWPALVLIAIYAISVLLFCTSMLSTSTVMKTVATEPCPSHTIAPVDQVVLLLIDAMRPDFVLSNLRPYAKTGGRCDLRGDTSLAAVLADQRYTGPTLRCMEDALRTPEETAVGYFLVADAPTTTAQRIKAIATGTMPAFLEAGSNFNSEATELDSIIGQMGGRAVLLGDDTWLKLFPNTPQRQHWKRAVGIPSFDVADFHTNDDAVLQEVYEVLETETTEVAQQRQQQQHTPAPARLIVAHFLGIDHVGHRVDSDNPYMRGKILQLDEMLRNVSDALRKRATSMNAMLLVLGDHGMTNSGDHGGDSAQETDTFLFAQYFSGRLNKKKKNSAAQRDRAMDLMKQRWSAPVDEELMRLRSCADVSGVSVDRLGAAYQVDVTATVAVLLGRPIPFSSFGRVLPEVLALADAAVDVEAAERCNEQQLARYFTESAMHLPLQAPWQRPGLSTAGRVAAMSFYARRTRTDMNRAGMFFGSAGVLLCAMSLLWSPAVRGCLSLRAGWTRRWTTLVLVLRLCSVFSNSFVVNEDSELLGLLSTMLLLLLGVRLWKLRRGSGGALQAAKRVSVHDSRSRVDAASAQQAQHDVLFLSVLLMGLRVAVPVLLRYRAHITHTVETESSVDRVVEVWPFLKVERLGLIVGGMAWTLTHARTVPLHLLLIVATTWLLMMGSYHAPVLHHLFPLLCLCAYPSARAVLLSLWLEEPETRPMERESEHVSYAYIVLVLWLTTLCNGKVATSVVIALYGVTLPLLCRLLRSEPLATQAVVLHLAAFVAFFAEGHQCMLNTIDWNASFVGMPGYNLYAGGLLVLSRTFHVFLLTPCALYLSAYGELPEEAEAAASEREVSASISASRTAPIVVMYAYLCLLIVQSAVSCFNGYIQKTHLMLYPIFCPKLLFDAVIALLSSIVVLVCILASR